MAEATRSNSDPNAHKSRDTVLRCSAWPLPKEDVRGDPFLAAAPKSSLFRLRLRYHTGVSRVTAGTQRIENRRGRSSRCDDSRRQRQLCSAGHLTCRERTTRLGNAAPRGESLTTHHNERCYLVPHYPLRLPPKWTGRGHAAETNEEQFALHQAPPDPKDQQYQEPNGW